MPFPTSTPKPLTVGKLAALADVSANAVRFYEREGLMQVPAKTESGYRLYGPQGVQRLRFIRQAQHCGFTLSEIQALLQLRDEASSCCNDVRNKVVEKKLELEARARLRGGTRRAQAARSGYRWRTGVPFAADA